jgi:hypothetical protein
MAQAKKPDWLPMLSIRIHPHIIEAIHAARGKGNDEFGPSVSAWISTAIEQRLAKCDLPAAIRTRLDSLAVTRGLIHTPKYSRLKPIAKK